VNWIYNWVPKAQQVTLGRGTRKSYISVSDSIKPTFIQTMQFACSNSTSAE